MKRPVTSKQRPSVTWCSLSVHVGHCCPLGTMHVGSRRQSDSDTDSSQAQKKRPCQQGMARHTGYLHSARRIDGAHRERRPSGARKPNRSINNYSRQNPVTKVRKFKHGVWKVS